jgi:hypothetical protein
MYEQHYSIDKSPSWEANIRSAGQEITLFIRDSKVHYRVHNSTPLVPSWARWIRYTASYLNIILTYAQVSQMVSFIQFFYTKILYAFLVSPMPRPSRSPWFDHRDPDEEWAYMKLLITQFSPVSCYFLPLRTKYSPSYTAVRHPHSYVLTRHVGNFSGSCPRPTDRMSTFLNLDITKRDTNISRHPRNISKYESQGFSSRAEGTLVHWPLNRRHASKRMRGTYSELK